MLFGRPPLPSDGSGIACRDNCLQAEHLLRQHHACCSPSECTSLPFERDLRPAMDLEAADEVAWKPPSLTIVDETVISIFSPPILRGSAIVGAANSSPAQTQTKRTEIDKTSTIHKTESVAFPKSKRAQNVEQSGGQRRNLYNVSSGLVFISTGSSSYAVIIVYTTSIFFIIVVAK